MTDWLRPLEGGRRPAAPGHARRGGGPATFEEAVERFADRHVSKRTGRPFSITSRRNVLDNLLGSPLTAYRARHGIRTVQQWSGDHAAAYLRWLHEDLRRNPATIMKVRGQLRSFGSYCDSHYRTAGAGSGALATLDIGVDPSGSRRSEEALTREEADAVMRAAPTPRDRLAVTMLLYTGMRPSELLSLQPRDIDLRATPGVVHVRGSVHAQSTRTSRTVPLTIGQTALPLLLKLHLQDMRGAAGARQLFVSKRAGANGEPTPLTLNGLRAMLFDLGRDTGIPCQAGRLRHTFCTWCAAAGVPVLELQQLLGLASTDTVAVYYRDRRAGATSGIAARVRFGPGG